MARVPHRFDLVSADDLRRRGTRKWTAYSSDVLPLWLAEMDYPTSPEVVAALQTAVRREEFGYAAAVGDTDLPVDLASWCAERYDWQVDPATVELMPDVVSAIEVATDVVSEPGTPMVTLTPAYMPFFAVASQLGRPMLEVPLARNASGDTIDLDGLDAAFAAGAQVLILCQPHNPVGRSFTTEELRAVSLVVQAHGGRVISDEIHAPLVYPGRTHVPYASVSPDAAAHSITMMSATKAWNLAGLNCAQVVLTNGQDHDRWRDLPLIRTHGVSPLGIRASSAAYRHGAPWLGEVLGYLDGQRQLLRELLTDLLPEVGYHEPEATYFAWLDFTSLGLGPDPAAFLLEHARVALSSGPPFGAPGNGFARLNLATSRSLLEQAVTAMARAVRHL